MATAARERAKRAAGAREVLVTERAQLEDPTTETQAQVQARADALARLRVDLDAAAPRDVELAAAISLASTGAESALRAVRALAVVRVPDDLRDVVQQIDDARSTAERAVVDADASEAAAIHAESTRDEQPALDELRAAMEAHTARAALSARIEKGAVVLAEQARAAESAKDALIAASERLEQAEVALEDTQHRHAHATLRASLRIGEPCPVCDQDVAKVPPKLRAAALESARKNLTAARKERQQVERAAQAALTSLGESRVRLDGLEEQMSAFAARVSAYPDPVELAALTESVDAFHVQATAARAEATRTRGAARETSKLLASFDAALARAEAALQEQRDGLVAAGLEPPRMPPSGLTARWDALAGWADETRPEHEKRAAELDDIARAGSAEREAMLGDLTQRALDLRVEGAADRSVGGLTLAVAEAQHDADEALRTIERRLARAAELDADIAAARDKSSSPRSSGASSTKATSASGSSTRRSKGSSRVPRSCSIVSRGASTPSRPAPTATSSSSTA